MSFQGLVDGIGSASARAGVATHLGNKAIFLHAVHLRVEHGFSLKKIATRLELPYGMVYKWHKEGLLDP